MIPGTGKGAGFLSSFRYACEGLSASFKGRNFRIQVGVAALAIFLCWLLHVSCVETCVVLICMPMPSTVTDDGMNMSFDPFMPK